MYYCLCECGNKNIFINRLKNKITSNYSYLRSKLTSKRSIEIDKRNAIDYLKD
jgi:hypothetical protein